MRPDLHGCGLLSIMPHRSHPAAEQSYARLRVDLDALTANYRSLRETAAPSQCAAVVKANAYGLGLSEVSQALAAQGCQCFFVSEVYEGLLLRELLPGAEIFVLSGITPTTAPCCVEASLTPVLGNGKQIEIWRELVGARHPVAVKVDTGMSRLGFRWDEARPSAFCGLEVSLLMTHLACADTPAHPLNQQQVERFNQVLQAFSGIRTSIGNSAGTLNGSATRGDLCRCGIGIYGGNPLAVGDNAFRPVAYLEGQVLQVTRLAKGESIGYGASFHTSRNLKVATLGIGYANGLPRALSNIGEAARGKETFPIVGRVSMNLTTIAVNQQSDIETGDWIQLIGDVIEIDEVARLSDTIAYEILTGLKAPRMYC